MLEKLVSVFGGVEMAGIGNRWGRWSLSVVLAALALVGCISALTGTPMPESAPTLSPISTRIVSATPTSVPLPTPTPFPTVAPTVKPLPVELTRGPYLQSVTQTGVTVDWTTDVPCVSQVDYGETDQYGLTASNSTPVTRHVVALTGLKPYTHVHYRVTVDNQPLSEDAVFRTAPPPDQASFRFVVYGDTRSDPVAHQKVVNSILTLSPDFLLHTGDFVQDGLVAEGWTTFFSVERKLLSQSPLYGVLGNHERESPIYFDVFHFPGNERWYSFDYGNLHLVALQMDSQGGFNANSEQARWLASDLAQTRQPWKIVFFHVPPYSSGEHRGDEQIRAALEPILIKYHVDLVFNGHDHDYERLMTKGVVYIVSGGGGAPLYRQTLTEPASAYFTNTYHSVLVQVNGLQINIAGVRTDGARFDEFALRKTSPDAPAEVVK